MSKRQGHRHASEFLRIQEYRKWDSQVSRKLEIPTPFNMQHRNKRVDESSLSKGESPLAVHAQSRDRDAGR